MNNDFSLYDIVSPLLEKQEYKERYRYTDVATALAPNYGILPTSYTIKGVPYVYSAKDAPIDIKAYLGKIADIQDPMTLLNSKFAPDPLVVYIPKNEKPKNPIRIENTLSGNQDTMVVRRVLVILEEGAEATIFFVDHVKGEKRYLTSQVIEVFCKANTHLDMYDLEETNEQCCRFSNLYLSTERDAVIRHNNITLTNGITRNGIDVYMRGENSEVNLNGAVIADRKQHVDNNTLIVHEVPKCTSTELYKYVADDDAVAAFAGRILVKEGAQQTSSQMTNNNMCCADTARVFTQPMLEIYADDVKCAHGSTVGVMDEAAIFYMQQRGVDINTARTLIKNAFISQVIEEMKWTAFHDRLHILVDKRLSKEERCGTCKICK